MSRESTQPIQAGLSRRTLVFLAAICLIYLGHALFYWDWVEDDAFISLRYAQNFAEGSGLVFNPGETVEGYSNLAWVLYAALAIKMNLDPLLVLKMTAILAGLLTLVLSWRAVGLLLPAAGMSALAAPLFLALGPMLPRHATTGLETVPFAALIVAGFVASNKKPNSAGFLLILVLLVFMRPEGLVFALLFLFWRHVGSGQGQRSSRLMWGEFSALLVVVAAMLVWKWIYYGNPLPNTFYAKMTGEGRAFVDGFNYSLDFLRENGGAVLVGLYLANLLNPKIPRALLLASALVVVQAGIVIAAGGDWMHFYRFFVPVLPVIATGCAAGLGIILQMNHQTRKWPLLVVLVGTLAAAYVNIYKVERATGREVVSHVKAGTYLTDGYRQTAQWIVDNTPVGSSVALCDIGLVGYVSERPIVDMFGLIDPHISHLDGRQHFKSDAEYVLGKEPDVVVLVSSGVDDFLRIPDAGMFAHTDFREKYVLEKTIPMGFRNETVRIYRHKN
jgi:arabinofuranosyltransferase